MTFTTENSSLGSHARNKSARRMTSDAYTNSDRESLANSRSPKEVARAATSPSGSLSFRNGVAVW